MLSQKSIQVSLLFLSSALGSGCGSYAELIFHPEEASLQDIRSFVKSGVVSCRSMASRYQLLHDSADGTLHAVVSWNSKLMADADRLDATPQAQRGSFHCIPIVLKDNLDYTGLPTTGGVQALGRAITGSNAEVVQRLLTAGALVLGKSNLPDFALDGTNTFSSFGGQTVNPYNNSLTVYGSSGGSAAAISASLGVIGLGSDTYGSLILPASATGLVAIRPTQGLVPSTGVLPLMTQQDMVGPMARKVEDAAAALELLVDAKFVAMGSQSYTSGLSRSALSGLRIGYDLTTLAALPAPMLVPSPEVSDLFTQTLQNLSQAGATTKAVSALNTLLPTLSQVIDLSFQCMPVDFKQGLNSYLKSQRPEATTQTLADIIATGQYASSAKSFLLSAQSQTDTVATSSVCQQYLAAKVTANAAVTAFLDAQGIDLLVYPAANQPAFPIGPVPTGWYGFQGLSSPTGLPSLTMPMGIAPKSGAPVGLVFLARNFQEAKLVQAAYAYQEQFHPRSAPPATP